MAQDKRTEQARISIGEGKPDNIDTACSWMLGILSGGLNRAYVESVLTRAEAMVRTEEGREARDVG